MRLKELREEKDLTQTDIATAIGTSQRNISRWENESNDPTASFVIMLADFFECSTDYLLGRSDDFGNVTVKNEKPADLSDDELTLIEKYRRLQTGYQVLIENQIQVLLDHQKKSELPAQQEYGSQKKPNSKSR